MIQLHQFLVYVLKYLAEDDQITNDCSEYITLKLVHTTFTRQKQNTNMPFLSFVKLSPK